ncbi:MAG TPA: hypothetical protein VK536_09760 [Candidatus Limnocylindrales bacterium]|nr:hypothetical protein [Candidatus Limnocylindrales bacterium]
MIEAFLASMLLMSCLAMIPSQPNLQDSTGNLSSTGQNVLLSLDSNGHLATLVDNRDWTDLKSSIESALPLTVWFNLTVYDENMNVLNSFPICDGGAVSNSIVSVDYICASQNSLYTLYILQLQLSQVGST